MGEIVKIVFLGTASAEGYPASFCLCNRCSSARRKGGRNLRARSSICIDSEILVDLPPEVYLRSLELGIELGRIKYILITHSHEDHFYFYELRLRRWPFVNGEVERLRIFGSDAVARLLRKHFRGELRNLKIRITALKPFKEIRTGAYGIIPIPAVHSVKNRYETPLNYIIRKEDRTLLYACDSGPYSEKVLEFLKKLKLDAVIVEATMGIEGSHLWPYHMGFREVLAFRKWLIENIILGSSAPFVLTHFSHITCTLHEEMVRKLEPYGVTIAYDGYTFEI
ncbi:MAG: carbon-phosphorus lyase [Thermoprotei archaeon]|nr:MAG: carbon-phosphorus lyase [Thermoprotei archaeon]